MECNNRFRILTGNQSYGLDQYLTRNWQCWDLVKFIVGYERWNPKVDEWNGIGYIIPSVLRTYGFPANHMIIKPAPLGAGSGEWSVSLPQYVVNNLSNQFPDSRILIGPGNTLGLYSCGDGLIKERGIDDQHNPIDRGILEVWEWIGMEKVYLMKRD